MGIAIAAIALEPRNMREGRRKGERALARRLFTGHAPVGEPRGSRKVFLLALVEGSGAAYYSRGERTRRGAVSPAERRWLGVTCDEYIIRQAACKRHILILKMYLRLSRVQK